MFSYLEKDSKFIITASDIRIHECHSRTVATDIVKQLKSGRLLRDVLASNIENLSRLEERKQKSEHAKEIASSARLRTELDNAKSKNKKLHEQLLELKSAVLTSISKKAHSSLKKELIAEVYKAITGSYDERATLELYELTPKEIVQVIRYIAIFKRNNFNEHWQVNEFISNRNAWDQFDELRSNNRHANDFVAKGIYPKYFAIVCEILDIGGDGGSHLVDSHRY